MAKIDGREFTSGGSTMPNALLNFVPTSNLERLNESSRWHFQEYRKITVPGSLISLHSCPYQK